MKLYHPLPKDAAPLGQADPYMIQSGGKYYVYATHQDGVQLYKSDALLTGWQYCGLCCDVPGQKGYWAPCVIELDGKFYMYYSSMPEDTDDVHRQALQVAVASSPEGPFTRLGQLLPPFSIDAHVVTHKGTLYLFYSVNDETAARPGTYIVLDKLLSPTQAEGKPVAVVRPTLDEEIYQRDRFAKGVHWHTIEGAFYFHSGGTHFLMYSGSAYGMPTYFLGYSTAHGDADDLRELSWHKFPDENTYRPLLCANDFVEGTGHNSVIEVDGEYWVIYHGRDVHGPKLSADTRCMRADRLNIDSGRLSVAVTP